MGTNRTNAITLRTIKPLLDVFAAPTARPLRHASRHRPRDGDGSCHYATNFIQENWTEETMRKAAILATNASYNRWQIEVLFQDIKGAFAIEQARVRTIRRLTNLMAIATLAFVYFAHRTPIAVKQPSNFSSE